MERLTVFAGPGLFITHLYKEVLKAHIKKFPSLSSLTFLLIFLSWDSKGPEQDPVSLEEMN